MKEIFRRYPIGIQNFEQLRNMDCVYIDKTALIYQLILCISLAAPAVSEKVF